MPKIHQLSPEEAQKIAAGQVVERPANALKELIENSIDAGSTSIDIYIEQAGQKLIRVVDNGCGMGIDDVQLACARHATSKITRVDELSLITTFGFRGEALASMAAVGKLTLLTKEHPGLEGIKLIQYDGNQHITPITCNAGTDISIEDLFYNVPARKKFLKKDSTEWRQLQYMVQAFILSYPAIHYKLYHDGRMIYNCPPVTSYKHRMAQLWDGTLAQSALEIVSTHNHGITIEGTITHPHYYRYDRSGIFLFCNSRWIKNQEITRALLKGYMNVLPPARYPAAAITITVNPTEVDVNIHPRKEEVQFLHPRRVETLITQAVQKTLEQHLAQTISNSAHQQNKTIIPNAEIFFKPYQGDHETLPFFESKKKLCSPHPVDAKPFVIPTELFDQEPDFKHATIARPQQHIDIPLSVFNTPFNVTNTQEQLSDLTDVQLIGQLHTTYILLDHKDGLFVIDQHAAHERILYEKFKKERFSTVTSVELLFPTIIEVTEEQVAVITPYFDLLHEHGIQIETFGAKQLIVKAAPVHAKHIALDLFIKEVLGLINQTDEIDTQAMHEALHEKIHAQMACKAAVKAGDVLSQEHMKQLLKELSQTENRFACPHGRPTGWMLPLYELEKKFKRKL